MGVPLTWASLWMLWFKIERVNHRVARKKKGSYMSSDKLTASGGGKHIRREIEDTSSLSYMPNDIVQHFLS